MLDEIARERGRPRHSAFEEREGQIGEALRHTTEYEAARDLEHHRRVQAEVVPYEIRRRLHMPAVEGQAAVERDRQSQLTTTLPHRVVVVRAVEPIGVEPMRRTRPRECDRPVK